MERNGFFLTGDCDLYQPRPKTLPFNNNKTEKMTFLKKFSMMKLVQEHTVLTLTINNMIRRLHARDAASVLLRDVDIHSVKIPTKQDLVEKTRDRAGKNL